MTPRELDALVAVHLFGRKVVENEDCEGCGPDGRDGFAHYRPTLVNPPMEVCMGGVPIFGASWDGAGLVVEAMRKRGYGCHLQMVKMADDEWFVVFTERETSTPKQGDDQGRSLPSVVARAALKALGVNP